MKVKKFFGPFLDYEKQRGLSEKTIREHRRFLLGALSHSVQDIPVRKLRLTDAAQAGASGKSHGVFGPQRAVVVFRRLLKFIKESGNKISFDWRDIEVPKVPGKPAEYLTVEELEIVRNSLDVSQPAGLRTRTLIEVFLDTGMRISEAISLDRQDIDWERKEAAVRNVKTGDIEKVYFTDRSLEWLERYLEKRRDDLPALFISGRARMISCTARGYLRTHCRQLGIRKKICHHIFRKTFATKLIQAGANIKDVQVLCRHRSERTTLRYYVAADREKAKETHQRIFGP